MAEAAVGCSLRGLRFQRFRRFHRFGRFRRLVTVTQFGVAFTLLDGGFQRTQTNLGRAEVADLVDFEHGVHVGLVGEDFADLVGGDGVEAAAEGVELHEFKPRIGGHEARRRIQAGMVSPLVLHAQRHACDLAVAHLAESRRILGTGVLLPRGQIVAQMQVLTGLQLADRILGQHDHTQRADCLGDAVVDFRIDVVRPPGEHDAAAIMLLHVRERAQAFLLHVMLEQLILGVCSLDRLLGLVHRHVRPCEFLDDALSHKLMVGEVEIGAHVADAGFAQFGHIRADDDRVVRDDRAIVVVVGVGHEVLLVAHARVENRLDTLVEQPFDMAVHQLRRITDVLGGDGFDAGFEQFVAGTPGDDDLEAEIGEQGEPERVVLVHVEHARNADFAAGRLLVGQAAVGEAALVLVVVQVRPVGTLLLRVATAFAPVTGHVARTVLEGRDGELAVVLAQLAHITGRGH